VFIKIEENNMNKGEKIEVVQNLIDELRQMPKKDKEKLNDFIYKLKGIIRGIFKNSESMKYYLDQMDALIGGNRVIDWNSYDNSAEETIRLGIGNVLNMILNELKVS
jgi:hypothetical protein